MLEPRRFITFLKRIFALMEKPKPIVKHNCCTNIQYVWSYDHSFNLSCQRKPRQCVCCLNFHKYFSCSLLKHCFSQIFIYIKCKQTLKHNNLELWVEVLKVDLEFWLLFSGKKNKKVSYLSSLVAPT